MAIKIFADTADLEQMRALSDQVSGYTTNPTLMRKAGVTDYRAFAREALSIADGRPVSFEVLADDFATMERQAFEIASWGSAAYVKVPITNTRGDLSTELIGALLRDGVRVNVTAVFTSQQVAHVASCALAAGNVRKQGLIVSVFVGRIADTGRNAAMMLRPMRQLLDAHKTAELLWASTRQLYDLIEAEAAGADIITMTPDLLAKRALIGKSLEEYSRETVSMFYRDAQAAEYAL